MNWWNWALLAWALSGQIVWLRMGKTHWSWHVNWKSRLGLAFLLVTMVLMFALLGPVAHWALRDELKLMEDDET